MTENEYAKIERKFLLYYREFNENNRDIYIKYVHSFHVMFYMERLACKLSLSEDDIYLAKAIGLLHDIGRFEQLEKKNSFDDQLLDHADVAIDYLFTNNHIREFIDNSEYDEIIKKAIFYHNKIEIGSDMTERERLFAKMIRDMDKVDIYEQDAKFFRNSFFEKPTKKVVEDFLEGRLVSDKDSNNRSDFIIRYFGFLNDFNFAESLDILIASDNFTKYVKSIKVSEDNKKLFEELVEECNKRLNKNDNKVNVKENNNGRIE